MDYFCKCIGFVHTIEKGDTLYLLGKKYNVRVSALIFANPYVDVYNLQPGDQLCIPKLHSAAFLKNSKEAKNETPLD